MACTADGSLEVGVSAASLGDGNLCDRRPRLSSESNDRYISCTELLTYTIERQDLTLPLGVVC